MHTFKGPDGGCIFYNGDLSGMLDFNERVTLRDVRAFVRQMRHRKVPQEEK